VEPWADVVTQYERFATDAADSPCFADWSRRIAADDEVVAWISTLPGIKRQPNLVLAAARWHGVPAPGPYDGLRDALLGDDGTIRATILTRATQTNEVGRLATLTPLLARLGPGPLALVEAGASAGLCLYPDRWSYEWHTEHGTVTAGEGPRLTTRVAGPFPADVRLPEVAWRRGVDLHPLSVDDADQMAWLANLVWPEQEERRQRLRTAVEIARTDPPRIVTGDLLEELPALVEEAAAYGTVVVFHSAVVAYLDEGDRRRFHQVIAGLVAAGRCHWVSNEGRQVLPEVTATGPGDESRLPFVLGLDGRAEGWSHGHGAALRMRRRTG
jgi:hypothetical protein